MVHSPGTCRASGMVTHTISVVPHITSTSPSRSAPATICSHSASTAPIASTAPVPCTCPAAAPIVSTRGICSGAGAALGAGRRIPAGPVEQGVRGGRGGEVDHRLARQGVVGHRRRRPVPGRIGGLGAPSSAGTRRPRPAREAAEPVPSRPPTPGRGSSPYSRPGVRGRPAVSTAVSEGTIAETATRALGPGSQLVQGRQRDRAATPRRRRAPAGRGPAPATGAGCVPAPSRGRRSSAATALTAVVPMSMPIVTSLA